MLKARGLERFAQQVRGVIRLGGYNHSIGLATHDVMGGFGGADEVLAPAITPSGYENLSAAVPRSVAEMESLMKKDGPLQILRAAGF